jgi:hypothetical protein
MKLSDLKRFDLIYVGTPYTKYKGGIEVAFVDACKLTARLMSEGLKVYSPIAHTHPLAIHGGLNPIDHEVWLPFDEAMMAKSDAILVAMMAGWEASFGIHYEIRVFIEASKPVYFLDPADLGVEIVTDDERAQFRSSTDSVRLGPESFTPAVPDSEILEIARAAAALGEERS